MFHPQQQNTPKIVPLSVSALAVVANKVEAALTLYIYIYIHIYIYIYIYIYAGASGACLSKGRSGPS